MLSHLNAGQKGLILVLVPLLFEILFLCSFGYVFSQAKVKLARLEHSQNGLITMLRLETDLLRTSLAITFLRNDDSNAVLREIDKIQSAFVNRGALGSLNKQDYPELAAAMDQTDELRATVSALGRHMSALIKQNSGTPAKGVQPFDRNEVIVAISQLSSLTREVEHIEGEYLAYQPGELEHIRFSLLSVLFVGLLANGLLSVLLVRLFTGDVLYRLASITANAFAVANEQPLNPALRGSDEIALLDKSLHECHESVIEARQREKAVLDHASDVVCSLDLSLKFSVCGSSCEAQWGYAAADLIGRSILSIVTKDTLEMTRKSLESICGDDESDALDDFAADSQSVISLESSDVSGVHRGALTTSEGSGSNSNSNLGADSDSDSELRTISKSYCSDDPQVGISSKIECEFENRIECSNGTVKDVLWSVRRAPGDRLIACVGHDITDLRSIERLRMRFLSIVSHDLRSPLHAILIGVSILLSEQKGELSLGASDKLLQVERDTEKLSKLLNAMLDLDKLESGRFELDLSALNPENICVVAKETIESEFDGANVSIDCHESMRVLGEARYLIAVLVSLLHCLASYSPPEFRITMQVTAQDSNIVFALSSSDASIPVSEIGTIFERFRVKGLNGDNPEVGLVLAKALVEAHRGGIEIDTATVGQTCFRIVLRSAPVDWPEESP